MSELDIGSKAKELDKMSMKERAKVDKKSIKKLIVAILFYILIMIFFSMVI